MSSLPQGTTKDPVYWTGEKNAIHLDMPEEPGAVQATLYWAGKSDDMSRLDSKELSSAKTVVNAPGIERLPLALKHVGL